MPTVLPPQPPTPPDKQVFPHYDEDQHHYYLSDDQGYEPVGYHSLSQNEWMEYTAAAANWQSWQQRIKRMLKDSWDKIGGARDEDKERAELARLKAKYEAKP